MTPPTRTGDEDALVLEVRGIGRTVFRVTAYAPGRFDVGYIDVAVDRETGGPSFIIGLAVNEPFRRRGLATRLYQAACREAGQMVWHDNDLTPQAVAWARALHAAEIGPDPDETPWGKCPLEPLGDPPDKFVRWDESGLRKLRTGSRPPSQRKA